MLSGSCAEKADDVTVAEVGEGSCGKVLLISDNAGGGRDKREESGVAGAKDTVLLLSCDDGEVLCDRGWLLSGVRGTPIERRVKLAISCDNGTDRSVSKLLVIRTAIGVGVDDMGKVEVNCSPRLGVRARVSDREEDIAIPVVICTDECSGTVHDSAEQRENVQLLST